MTRSILTVKVAFIIGIILLLTNILQAQRQMENLNRGVIAVAQGDGKVYVGWRMLDLINEQLSLVACAIVGPLALIRDM